MSWLDSWQFGKVSSRRVKVFEMSFQGVAGLLQLDGSFVLKMEGFPVGGRLSFIEADNERGILKLYVEHELFEEIEEGAVVLPQTPITVTRYELPKAVLVEEKEG